MAKLYTLDSALLRDVPEIRVGERIYFVDNRMSTFLAMNKLIRERGETCEFEIVVKAALGEDAFLEIAALDMPFAAAQQLVILILAAMQDITEEEAKARFRPARA